MRAPKNHSDCCNLVRLALTEIGALSVPYTVGMFRQMDPPHRPIRIGRNGFADEMACLADGRYLGAEVKFSETDKLSEDQEKYRDAVLSRGGVWVLADFRDGRDGLEGIRSC